MSGFQGARVRSYDFEPIEGRDDIYVDGRVISVNEEHGVMLIAVDFCSRGARVGKVITTPIPGTLGWSEWDGRIIVLETAE